MTLKDKKNKREYNRKLKAEGGVSTANKGQEKASTSKKDGKQPKDDQVSSFKGAKEDSSKLLTEANQRFTEAEAERVRTNQTHERNSDLTLISRRRRMPTLSIGAEISRVTGLATRSRLMRRRRRRRT